MIKSSRNQLRLHRKKRIRAKVQGTSKLPRLAIFKSLSGIYVQAIDDVKGITLVSASSKEAKLKNDLEGAKKVGLEFAKKCLEKKIKEAVFDRSGYKYHGKVRALAEGSREGGLKF